VTHRHGTESRRTLSLLMRAFSITLLAAASVASACLQTESLGRDLSAVLTCAVDECPGTPPVTTCSDGQNVASTGRCIRRTATSTCEWELGDCSGPVDASSGDTAVNDAADSSVSTDSDASGDALVCADDTVAVSGTGPWDEAKACWIAAATIFECVDTLVGARVQTCFFQLSTSRFYLAPTSDIPSGSDFRLCTTEERDARGGVERLCR
jgi:hypothetical protein